MQTPTTETFIKLCASVAPADGIPALETTLKQLIPEYDFRWILTRGHWHRLGGVVDGDYQRISDNIRQWAEAESDGGDDIDELVAKYQDAGYFATQLAGRTLYLTAPTGDKAENFIQLEIEELQEVLDRPLMDPDWFPDSLEEFLEPLDVPRLEPEPIGTAYYQFRRITYIDHFLGEEQEYNSKIKTVRRFFQDWNDSSAAKADPFCRFWVLELRAYMDRDGDPRLSAKPVSSFAEPLPEIPAADTLHGVELAKALRSYDNQLGYPFAWYFILLTRKAANYALAEAVLHDQDGEYDYLPQRDLNVLNAWARKPYGV
jgi:hypothetical protein